MQKFLRVFGLCAAFAFANAPTGWAQSVGPFTLELNKSEGTNLGCVLTYVALNKTGQAIDNVSYEVVVFDTDGVVSQFLVLDFGALSHGRTRVVQFEIQEPPCSQISRIHINNLSQCSSQGLESGICWDALVPTSRSDIKFGF